MPQSNWEEVVQDYSLNPYCIGCLSDAGGSGADVRCQIGLNPYCIGCLSDAFMLSSKIIQKLS